MQTNIQINFVRPINTHEVHITISYNQIHI